jgi:hypothetical protein
MSVDDGGEAGESSGGTGGTGGKMGGAAGKGSAGTGGKSGAGGAAGASSGGGGRAQGGSAGQAGGSAGQGGGTAGQNGAAGTGTAGMVGVLGTQCSPPGALACAGNHQKLTVLCGGSGMWEANQTCGADLYCDSTPGPTVGLCTPVAEGCDAGPGTVFCSDDEKQIVTCGPDAVTKSEVACDGACHRGVCRDDRDVCLDWDDYEYGTACAKDCGEPVSTGNWCPFREEDGCYSSVIGVVPGLVRTPWSDDVCSCESVEGRTMVLVLQPQSMYSRVTVSPPWSIGSCGQDAQHCLVVDYAFVELWTPSLDAGPVNIIVEEVGPQATCP